MLCRDIFIGCLTGFAVTAFAADFPVSSASDLSLALDNATTGDTITFQMPILTDGIANKIRPVNANDNFGQRGDTIVINTNGLLFSSAGIKWSNPCGLSAILWYKALLNSKTVVNQFEGRLEWVF